MKRLFDRALELWNGSMPLRFLFVGGWNFVFGYGQFAFFWWWLNGRIPDIVIYVLTAIIGITHSFVTHRFLTYESHGVWWREYLRFYVVYGAQELVSIAALLVFVTWLGFNAYIMNLLITVFITVTSYWAHKYYSFKEKKS